ncbi:LOS biosynthesis enzyme LBGB [Agarivorans sp. OAG1]|uniref:glycosyltransferase family 9 protein n=1 Tax=Agarivorans sp. OAG1 TaxID=3082387 RepID=UPI002B2E3E49|nr:LOS biosynthesis enzyme LBGB [Agarivorans sp. OAG1]
MLKDNTFGRLLKWRERLSFFIGKWLFDKPIAKLEAARSIQSILVVRGDGKIGDSVVSSFLYRELKSNNQHLSIGVLCTPNSRHLFDADPHIDKVHCYPKRAKLWQVRSLLSELPDYDAVVFLAEVFKPRDFLMLRCLNAKANVGVADNVALINCNIASKVAGQHSQQYFVEAAKSLGFAVNDFSYHFNLPDVIDEQVLSFLGDKQDHYIAINAFGNTSKRSFSEARLREVLLALKVRFSYPIVALASPVTQKLVSSISASIDGVFCLDGTESIEQNAALIKHSKLFISVDTATVHLAHCFKTPMVAIYRQDPANFAMWSPNYQPTKAIFTRAAKTRSEEVSIEEFDLDELLDAAVKLLHN